MDLQQFIHDALFQIAAAVNSVNANFREASLSARANTPGRKMLGPEGGETYVSTSDTQDISFDVAVTVAVATSDAQSKEGGGRIAVLSGKVGSANGSESSQSSVSRLQLQVPLRLPLAKD